MIIVLLSACGGSSSSEKNNPAEDEISNQEKSLNNWSEGNWNGIDWQ